MTIDELNALTALTAGDEVPVWDSEESGEPTKKITVQNMTASVKALGSLVNTSEMNDAIQQSTATLLKYKTVTVSNSVAGTSWSQTARMIGTATNLFAIPASRIRSLQIRSAGIVPASACFMSLFNDDVYVSATQTATLGTDILVDICYE